tara:strand:+ start:305 stop:895 length:591 start_codon:yes stop_codon:yes gene_type:complete
MKKLLLILILLLSFQTCVRANDIKDFEIEGMSVESNLLDYAEILNLTKEQIKNKKLTFYPKSKRLGVVNFYDGKFEIYDSVQFTIDANNYKIYRISGKIYNLTKNECVEQQNYIISILEQEYPDAIKDVDAFEPHDIDETGESIANGIYLDFQSGDTFLVECYIWGKNLKEDGYVDHITVAIETKHGRDFIQNEAY